MAALMQTLKRKGFVVLPALRSSSVAGKKPSFCARTFTSGAQEEDPRNAPRESMDFDVVVVGAGPSGLSSAIRLKQLSPDLNVCVIEKGAEVGNHILSGACIEPHSLNELIPNWKEKGAPLETLADEDSFMFLTEKSAIRLPTPPQMQNHGNYIGSLGDVCKWLAGQAEELGIEIYPGFPAAEILYDDAGRVAGVATGDSGIGKNGELKDTFTRGMELRAKQTIFGEGCRGSLTKVLTDKFDLRKDCQRQTYGLGIKEIWEVPEGHPKWKKGRIMHTVGWPMDTATYGGSWMYHFGENRISIGFVVALDYENPYLSPYQEFQRFKQHPHVRSFLEGGQCISYGARTISEGGLQSLPKLTFPGGVLVGDTAGFLNVPKIKGTHTAMKSGMLAAEAVLEAVTKGESEATTYTDKFKSSWLHDELYNVRNVRPAFKYGLWGGLAINAVDTYLFRGKAPFTIPHSRPDHEHTKPAKDCKPIQYPKPDGVISFDLLTNLTRSGTNHNHDQPAHLKLKDSSVPTRINLPVYDGPEGRFCPARVYEYVQDEAGQSKLQINAQNCLHCKACDIKDPTQNINWTTPEGGGGPAYNGM